MSAKNFMSYGDAETVFTAIANAIKNNEDAVAAVTSALTAIKDGTDLDSFGDVEVALLDKADISDLGTAAAKDSTNSVTAGSTDLVESGAVKDAIDAAVAAAYHHAGTKTVAQLTHDLLIAANEGNVYNVTDSGTTTSDFIEGIGKQIDAGDNVGICKVGNVYMFDLLSGLEDTSIFVQKSQTAGLLKNDGTVNTTIEDTVAGHTTAIAGKQDTLTFDDTPTDGSNNPVKSNGIYDSEKDIYAAMGEMGAKNLIKYPFATNSGNTYRGITFTYDDSQILYANGTTDASKDPYFNHVFSDNKVLIEANKKYILSIESNSEYAYGDIWFRNVSDYTSISVAVNATYSDGDILSATQGHISTKKLDNTMVPYVIFSVATSVYVEIQTRYNSGSYVISNKYSKVMLRLASDTDNKWQPYVKTNKQLTDDVALLESEKADTDMVAADFNAGTSYTVGNYCVQDGKLYKFKNNHSGAWSSADVDEVKIAGELSALKSGLTNTAKLLHINAPADKADVNGFLGYILASIIENQSLGAYLLDGAWISHDYYTGVVYKVSSDTAIGMFEYGTIAQSMALYSACYKLGVYSEYKTVQYSS